MGVTTYAFVCQPLNYHNPHNHFGLAGRKNNYSKLRQYTNLSDRTVRLRIFVFCFKQRDVYWWSNKLHYTTFPMGV